MYSGSKLTPLHSSIYRFLGTSFTDDPEVGDIVYVNETQYLYTYNGWEPIYCIESESKFEITTRNCPSCGAPVELHKTTCSYCNVPYPSRRRVTC